MALTVNHPLLKEVRVYATIADSAAASTLVCVTCPIRGKIIKLEAVNSAVVDADRVITVSLGTGASPTAITGGAITLVASGSVIGGATSVVPTALNAVNEGDTIQFVTDGAGSTSCVTTCIATIQAA